MDARGDLTTDPGPRPGVFRCRRERKGLLAVGDDNRPRPARHGQGPVFHVKHSEAREYSPKARDFRRFNPRFIRRFIRQRPAIFGDLFAKGPRRRQIKERGPRGAVLKCLIRRGFALVVVPKARDLLGVIYFHDSCLWMADYVPDA